MQRKREDRALLFLLDYYVIFTISKTFVSFITTLTPIMKSHCPFLHSFDVHCLSVLILKAIVFFSFTFSTFL